MALFVGLDVSLKFTSTCAVEADGSRLWAGKAESEPASLIKTLIRWRESVKLAIIMHRMWTDGTDFRFGQPAPAQA